MFMAQNDKNTLSRSNLHHTFRGERETTRIMYSPTSSVTSCKKYTYTVDNHSLTFILYVWHTAHMNYKVWNEH